MPNPRLHIICGFCGSNQDLKYRLIDEYQQDDAGNEIIAGMVACTNCSTLTRLDEIIPDEATMEKK